MGSTTDHRKLIPPLFRFGLGEYFILHIAAGKTILGKLHCEQAKLRLKDEGYLAELKPKFVRPCWERGLIGMICAPIKQEWESLTFHGLENCNLPVDLESTRYGGLSAAQNQYGEKLIAFTGSVYRGFNLMLDNHFLPVILLQEVMAKSGEPGLAVSDLRVLPLPIPLIQSLHDKVQEQVARRRSLNVAEDDLSRSDFQTLFGRFLERDTDPN